MDETFVFDFKKSTPYEPELRKLFLVTVLKFLTPTLGGRLDTSFREWFVFTAVQIIYVPCRSVWKKRIKRLYIPPNLGGGCHQQQSIISPSSNPPKRVNFEVRTRARVG